MQTKNTYTATKITPSSNKLCDWCDNPAVYRVHNNYANHTDHACQEHYNKYYGPSGSLRHLMAEMQ